MNFRFWNPIVLLGLFGACSEGAESERTGARETGYLRCQAAPECSGANQVACVGLGGQATCVDVPAACTALDCTCGDSLCGEAACTDLAPGAIACVAADPSASYGVPPPIDSCFSGFLFADCGGELPPVIWCTQGSRQDCLWFSGGCPAEGYGFVGGCTEDRRCPTQNMSWGTEPWTRAREMNLSVQISPELTASEAVEVACTCDAPPCMPSTARLCTPDEVYQPRYEPDGNRSFGGGGAFGEVRSGLYVFAIRPWPSHNTYLGSTFLVAEVDLAAANGARARACLFQDSDGQSNQPPVCATSGSLVLDRAVANSADAAEVHGTAVLEFDSAPVQSGPLRIDLAF